MNNTTKATTNTEPYGKVLRWVYTKCTPISKTSTITYLELGNMVRVTARLPYQYGDET